VNTLTRFSDSSRVLEVVVAPNLFVIVKERLARGLHTIPYNAEGETGEQMRALVETHSRAAREARIERMLQREGPCEEALLAAAIPEMR